MIRYQGLSTLEVLKDAKNYNRWLAALIAKRLTTPAIEIGAGTGNLSEQFLHYRPLYLSDVDQGLVRELKKKFSRQKGLKILQLDITKEPVKSLRSSFATVFAINVLEHIKYDEQALNNIAKLLKSDGKLLLLVPAKKWAYAKLDQELGHFRRYEKEELVNKLIRNGYEVDEIFFVNIVGLLSWYVRDKVKRENINLKPYHIRVFDSIVPILRRFESYVKIPMGISLIVVARKI